MNILNQDKLDHVMKRLRDTELGYLPKVRKKLKVFANYTGNRDRILSFFGPHFTVLSPYFNSELSIPRYDQ